MLDVGCWVFDVFFANLRQHRPMKLVPIIEIVQVHRIVRRSIIIGHAARAQNALARFVIVNVAAHRGIVLFDRLSIY